MRRPVSAESECLAALLIMEGCGASDTGRWREGKAAARLWPIPRLRHVGPWPRPRVLQLCPSIPRLARAQGRAWGEPGARASHRTAAAALLAGGKVRAVAGPRRRK
jgi:hypothetical protein